MEVNSIVRFATGIVGTFSRAQAHAVIDCYLILILIVPNVTSFFQENQTMGSIMSISMLELSVSLRSFINESHSRAYSNSVLKYRTLTQPSFFAGPCITGVSFHINIHNFF